MNKITKVGITALAGSLVTLSAAVAGALDVSGGARLSYIQSDGNSDLQMRVADLVCNIRCTLMVQEKWTTVGM